jgi:hypothetical protein
MHFPMFCGRAYIDEINALTCLVQRCQPTWRDGSVHESKS